MLTIQKAIDVVAALDLSIYDVAIRVADGTYTAAATVKAPWVGSGAVTLTETPQRLPTASSPSLRAG